MALEQRNEMMATQIDGLQTQIDTQQQQSNQKLQQMQSKFANIKQDADRREVKN